MTDTVADPAVTPTSAQAEVTVSAAVVDAVRAERGPGASDRNPLPIADH